MISDAKWNAIFSGCPGAWFGNRPIGKERGHITVDPALVNEAATYLAGFVGTIRLGAGTRPSPREGIQIILRDAEYIREQRRQNAKARRDLMRSFGMKRVAGGWE